MSGTLRQESGRVTHVFGGLLKSNKQSLTKSYSNRLIVVSRYGNGIRLYFGTTSKGIRRGHDSCHRRYTIHGHLLTLTC